MQSIAPSIEVVPGSAGLRFPARLALLAGLFTIELLPLYVWLKFGLLQGKGGLSALGYDDWGALPVRVAVAVALGSLIFAESRGKTKLKRISAEYANSKIGWSLLASHAAGMLLFAWLSSILFQHAASGVVSNALVLVCALTGLSSLALAACALIPFRAWIEILRSSGDAVVYGLVAAVFASLLGSLTQRLWVPFSHGALTLTALMLRPFLSQLIVDPSTMTVGSPAFHVEVLAPCSGLEGMGLMLAFSSAWLWFFRRQWKFPQALLLIPGGMAVIWIANSARIAALVLIGNAGAPQIAVGGFHSQAGWIAFNIVAIGTCILARRIPALVHPAAAELGASRKVEIANPTAPYLMPFLAILAAAMVSRAMSADFEWFYSLRVIAAAGALWYFRRSYRDLDWRFGWVGITAGALVFAIWMGFEKTFHSPAPAALALASSAGRFSWVALRVIGAVVLVPIAEELAFRGFLLRRLVSSDFESVGWKTLAWTPLVISSLAFGILHGERWLAGTIAGAIFAFVQIRRGRIGEAIAAHSVANALIAAWVLIAGDWQLW